MARICYPGRMADTSAVDALMDGAVDLHNHIPPEIGFNRRFDAFETARIAEQYGLRAIVIKCHNTSTALTAFTIQRHLEKIEVCGSICIGYNTTGGLNEHTAKLIEDQAKIGCRVVWFPTLDAWWHCKFTVNRKGEGIYLLDEKGALVPYAKDVLKVIKEYDLLLCTGHISYPEAFELVKEAEAAGITKIVVTHPMSAVTRTPYTIEEMRTLVEHGAFIEHCWRNCLPQLKSYDAHKYIEAIKALGAEHTIMSTDFAQVSDPAPAEGLRTFIAVMLQFGVAKEDIEKMVKTNPYYLLGLDAPEA